MTEREDFTNEEQAALDAWTVPDDIGANLADVVLDDEPTKDEARTPPKRSRGRRWMALAGGAAAVAAIVLSFDKTASGELEAKARTTAMVGARATVVAEEGSALSWKVSRRGDAVVKQPRGNVFYRVERGGPFVVQAGDVKVRVLGTSFRVEVMDVDKKRAMALSAGAGALVATTVVVTVYEGRVVSASPAGKIELAAGEAAVLAPEAKPKKIAGTLSSAPKARDVAMARPDSADDTIAKIDTTDEPKVLVRELAVARAENRRLADQVQALQEKLDGPGRRSKSYDLDPATLNKYADECRLAWDRISLGPQPPTFPKDAAEKLQLSDDEVGLVESKFKDAHSELFTEIRRAYTAVTGDTETGSLAAQSMLSEVNDKTPKDEMQAIFRKLSAERAGRMPPPPEGMEMHPVERLYRALTTHGDRLEYAIGTELGPHEARRIRDANGGWNNNSVSSYGCPR